MRPLSERVRDEADEWGKAFDRGDVTDTCEGYLRVLAVGIAALEAENKRLRDRVAELESMRGAHVRQVTAKELVERQRPRLEGGDDD